MKLKYSVGQRVKATKGALIGKFGIITEVDSFGIPYRVLFDDESDYWVAEHALMPEVDELESLRVLVDAAYDAICQTLGWIDAFDDAQLEFDEHTYEKLSIVASRIKSFKDV